MDNRLETEPHQTKAHMSRKLIVPFAAVPLALILLALPVKFQPAPDGFGGTLAPSELVAAVQWNELPLPESSVNLTASYDRPFRTLTVDIPLAANDGDLEYKLSMRPGDSVVYSWRVLEISNPEWFYSEFHGHTEPSAAGVGDLMFYRKETGSADNGYFVAPFEGIHGWYLQNQSEHPVVVRLEVAGFYDEIPDQVPPLPAQ